MRLLVYCYNFVDFGYRFDTLTLTTEGENEAFSFRLDFDILEKS